MYAWKRRVHLKTVVFGGLDGILTSFAIVASCAGSSLSARTVLLLGACNILADALAMGVGEYLSSKSLGRRLWCVVITLFPRRASRWRVFGASLQHCCLEAY